jgi:hypothetical protein
VIVYVDMYIKKQTDTDHLRFVEFAARGITQGKTLHHVFAHTYTHSRV